MERDRQDLDPERPGALQQLVSGIIERVLRVIQGMDVEIELDPVGHLRAKLPSFLRRALRKDHAAAGHARFSLLQFRDVDRSDLKPALLEHCARSRKRSGHDDRTIEQENIGRGWFVSRDVKKFKSRQWLRVDPIAIHQQRVATDKRTGALQMETATDFHRDHAIPVRPEQLTQLLYSLLIRPSRSTHEDRSPNA